MPNPQMPYPPIEDRFDIAQGWRVWLLFQNGDGYFAQLERIKDGRWHVCGPVA